MNNLGKGILFVISGPSGVGKGTILAQVFKHIRGLCYSVSMTTRKPREGEIDKVNYYFVSKEEFEKTIQEDGFYEYVNVLGNYYGTPKKAVMEKIAKGNDVVLEIETIGAKKVKDSKPDNLVSIFIAPPTLDELKARLSGRGTEDETQVKKRMEKSKVEMTEAFDYDYIVINDDVTRCAMDIIDIIDAERMRVNRNKDLINEIINK